MGWCRSGDLARVGHVVRADPRARRRADESIPVSVFGSLGPLTGESWAVGVSIDVDFYSEFIPPGGMSVEQSGTFESGNHTFDIRLSAECDSHDQALAGTFSVTLVFGE